jgi:hydroxymethylglutaryl-CoA reductase
MALHARSVALSAGARGDEVERLAERLRDGAPVTVSRARDVLRGMRGQS